MTQQEFQKKAKELQELSVRIPLNWGCKQNDVSDGKLNIFPIDSFEELEAALEKLPEEDRNYCRRRWFIWKCSQCDEYLFNTNENVSPNPNPKDQAYDIEFNGDPYLRFDVKGTVIPRKLRYKSAALLQDPTPIFDFFYTRQSTGVRSNCQNRLFLVHHSFCNPHRELYLRCDWDFKARIYSEYCKRINSKAPFYKYKDKLSDIIFIVENLDKTFSYKFFAV